jgi:hypothetical protein
LVIVVTAVPILASSGKTVVGKTVIAQAITTRPTQCAVLITTLTAIKAIVAVATEPPRTLPIIAWVLRGPVSAPPVGRGPIRTLARTSISPVGISQVSVCPSPIWGGRSALLAGLPLWLRLPLLLSRLALWASLTLLLAGLPLRLCLALWPGLALLLPGLALWAGLTLLLACLALWLRLPLLLPRLPLWAGLTLLLPRLALWARLYFY